MSRVPSTRGNISCLLTDDAVLSLISPEVAGSGMAGSVVEESLQSSQGVITVPHHGSTSPPSSRNRERAELTCRQDINGSFECLSLFLQLPSCQFKCNKSSQLSRMAVEWHSSQLSQIGGRDAQSHSSKSPRVIKATFTPVGSKPVSTRAASSSSLTACNPSSP